MKSVSLLLFVIFTLQMTGIACDVDEPLFKTSLMQGEYQLKTADSGKMDTTDFSSGIIGHCQCPCHLSFMLAPAATHAPCLLADLSLVVADYFSLKKISTDIFQPPKVLI